LQRSPSVPSFDFASRTKSSDKEPMEVKISNMFG